MRKSNYFDCFELNTLCLPNFSNACMLPFFKLSILSSVSSSSPSKLVSVSTAPVRKRAGVFSGSTVPKIRIANLNH